MARAAEGRAVAANSMAVARNEAAAEADQRDQRGEAAERSA